jgi:uncharacterized protein (TIGR01777 family)
MPVFETRAVMPVPVQELFAYHARPGAFERLIPPWQRLDIVEQSGGMRDGGRVAFDVRVGPLKRRWVAEMSGYEDGRQFVDTQVEGPFASWQHTHRFVALDASTSELIDHVEYRLPAGELAGWLGEGTAERQLQRLFTFRHERTRLDLERHAAWRERPRLKVAISGAGGLIGSHLAVYLSTAGHEVVRLVRREAQAPDEVSWDPTMARLDPGDLAGVDAVVNLAGATIGTVWTRSRRTAIMASREEATGTLVAAIAKMETPPRVLVSSSAVGAYGSRAGLALTEESELGDGYLADVCRVWEAAAAQAGASGVRVVTPRQGIVVSASGGALAPMLPAFRAGLGTRIGDGTQWWSWVALDDVLSAYEWMLYDEELSGAVNLTAPEPVTNLEFTKTLGHVLHRPAVLFAPQRVVSTTLGGMAREMLLASQRAVPMRLRQRGFRFTFPTLEPALRYELGRF